MCPANEITNLFVVITATSPPVLGLSFVSYIMRIEKKQESGANKVHGMSDAKKIGFNYHLDIRHSLLSSSRAGPPA